MRFVLVGSNNAMRTDAWRAAADRIGLSCVLYPWEAALAGDTPPPADRVRIDPPTLTPEMRWALIGEARPAAVPPPPLPDPGLRQTALVAAGLFAVATRIAGEMRPARLLMAPDTMATLHDKAACAAVLANAGVAVAPALPGETDLDTLAEGSAFVKLRWGSAAAGILAVRRHPTGIEAFTTMVPDGDAFFSSRQVSRLSDRAEIESCLAWLRLEGAHTERWLPKDRIDGQVYDLRVLTIQGRAAHVVGRASLGPHPFTNLHLGGRRLSRAALVAHLGDARFQEVLAMVERAAACFEPAVSIGFDVMWTADGPVIIEANPFGDLVHDVRWNGDTPQEAVLRALTTTDG